MTEVVLAKRGVCDSVVIWKKRRLGAELAPFRVSASVFVYESYDLISRHTVQKGPVCLNFGIKISQLLHGRHLGDVCPWTEDCMRDLWLQVKFSNGRVRSDRCYFKRIRYLSLVPRGFRMSQFVVAFGLVTRVFCPFKPNQNLIYPKMAK